MSFFPCCWLVFKVVCFSGIVGSLAGFGFFVVGDCNDAPNASLMALSDGLCGRLGIGFEEFVLGTKSAGCFINILEDCTEGGVLRTGGTLRRAGAGACTTTSKTDKLDFCFSDCACVGACRSKCGDDFK